MIRHYTTTILLLTTLAFAHRAGADPIDSLGYWEGHIDYFATGAPLAVDGPDSDSTQVDTLDQPAYVDVAATDVPATATVVAAYLYWSGTVEDGGNCASTTGIDDEVDVGFPGAGTTTTVTADECYCAAGASSYDIQACRADVTADITASGMLGTWSVEGFAARITNGSTDNASFSVVLVFEEPDLLPPRRIALYDGCQELYRDSFPTVEMNLDGLDADSPAHGELTWYVLDGDVGGEAPESVVVTGVPGGASVTVSDSINPADNPMNRTINTTSPVQTNVVGVDIDQLDISDGITAGDTSVDMTYTGGGDKYWVVYNIVGINVYRALLHDKFSYKNGEMHDDADASGTPTPGDTIRYTIHLQNSGTAPGYVDLEDPMPSQVESWTLVDAAGGTDASTATTLIVEDIYIDAGDWAEVVVDVVIATGTLGESMENVASFDAGPDGNAGDIRAPIIFIGEITPEDPGTEPVPDLPPDTTEPASDTMTDTAVDTTTDVPADTGSETPDAGTDTGPIDPPDQDMGCGCSIPSGGPGNGVAGLLLILGLALAGRRRH